MKNSSIRLPDDLRDALAARAQRQDRTLSWVVRRILRTALDAGE